jgi:hypothetical protein
VEFLVLVLDEILKNVPKYHMVLHEDVPHLELENIVTIIWLEFQNLLNLGLDSIVYPLWQPVPENGVEHLQILKLVQSAAMQDHQLIL